MEKLAKWRINRSLIEYPEDLFELHGGHGTVSRAFLTPSADSGGHASGSNGLATTERKVGIQLSVFHKDLRDG